MINNIKNEEEKKIALLKKLGRLHKIHKAINIMPKVMDMILEHEKIEQERKEGHLV